MRWDRVRYENTLRKHVGVDRCSSNLICWIFNLSRLIFNKVLYLILICKESRGVSPVRCEITSL